MRELTALARMNAQVLRAKYREVYGEATTSRDATYLRRKIAWAIQWQAEDRFPEHIRARLAEPSSLSTQTSTRSLRSRQAVRRLDDHP